MGLEYEPSSEQGFSLIKPGAENPGMMPFGAEKWCIKGKSVEVRFVFKVDFHDETRNTKHETRRTKHETRNTKSETRTPNPEPRNPKP